MIESEWLACDEPEEMWLYLYDLDQLDDRKYRLYGCACVRDVWQDLPNEVHREAITICERFVEGQADLQELDQVREAVQSTSAGIGDIIADFSAMRIADLCHRVPHFPMGTGSSGGIDAVAAEIRFDQYTPWHIAHKQAKILYCKLFRDIFGNPFRPVTFAPEWRTEAALGIAAKMYDSRDFGNMPILADALQDAGCEHADILSHCRGDGPHVRGCWVVDLVLGKT